MEVPEQSAMHNYAYNPSVASWVHSTSLAQLDNQPDDAPPDPSSPDDFYKSAYPPPTTAAEHDPVQLAANPPPPLSSSSIDMATTRQRQHTPNGAALSRSTTKPTVRSVSGPATSTVPTASRATPHLPINRPTVRSLAQKFNQPTAKTSSSAETSPSVARRPVRPSVRSTTESSPAPASASPSPARPNKEAAYGSYKFNNLKPRERPQPAPSSPAGVRRSNVVKAAAAGDHVKSPIRRKIGSPIREGAASSTGGSRKLFFGEVVGEHDASLPGFGIPTLDPASNDSPERVSSPPRPPHNTTIKLVTDESVLAPERASSEPPDVRYQSSGNHTQQDLSIETRPGAPDNHHVSAQHQEADSLNSPSSQRRSPRSRIPVASRRMSTASDSSSSNRSLKFSGARPVQYSRASPTRLVRKPVGKGTISPPKPSSPAPATLPAVSYHRGYRERGKSPKGPKSGPSVAAVITAPPPPLSPRLRNSRERQMLQESPGAKSASPSTPQEYFGNNDHFSKEQDSQIAHIEQVDGFQGVTDNAGVSGQQSVNGVGSNASIHSHQHQAQSVEPPPLQVFPDQRPTSTMTGFEDESPILGIPGSFIMTPPLLQQSSPSQPQVEEPQRKSIMLVEPEPEPVLEPAPLLLQPNVFRPASPNKGLAPDSLNIALSAIGPSELGVRESIPIMLGSDDPRADWEEPVKQSRHSPRLDMDAHRHHRHQSPQRDLSRMPETTSYYQEESPIDPISRHESLRPEDSVSVAFYQHSQNRIPEWTPHIPSVPEAGSFTLDSEAYSVINKVLNMYHQSEVISPDMASSSQMRVHAVSPIIAQHKDWGSKEATETYLARLLSDANGVEEPKKDSKPFPTEQSSNRSSIPSLSIRELEEDPADFHSAGTAIIFPSESRRYSRSSRGSATTTIADDASRPDSSGNLVRDYNQAAPSGDTGSFTLPQIAWSNEGLGLSLHSGHSQTPPQQPIFSPPPQQQQQPMRPQYSPPPPPVSGSNEHLPTATYKPATDFSTKYTVHSDLNSSPYAKSIQPTKAPAVSIHAHPARTSTPVKEQTLEDRYGTPQPVDIEEDLNETDTFKVVDQDASTLASADISVQADQPDSEEKQALKKKFRIVQEMLKTEHGFCIDMMIAHNIFESTAHNVMDEKERRTLFSNCKELEKFSLQLFRMLKKAAKPIIHYDVEEGPPGPWNRDLVNGIMHNPPDDSIKLRQSEESKYHDEFEKCTPANDRETTIGNVFLETAPKMERLFTTYFLNHNNACEYIKKNNSKQEVQGWVTACFQQVEGLTQAWDLDSLLVKPCQRLLKYPLLLEQLEQVTTADHPDLQNIILARKQLVEISGRINQAKRRSETLRAATSEGQKKEKSKGLGIGKNIVKAFTSKQDKTKAYEEAAALFRDDEYRKLSQKFGGHFFQLQIVLRDFECYLEAITEHYLQLNIVLLGFITVSETGPSCHPEMESTWRKWAMAHFELQNKALEEHKSAVRTRALKPISDLWSVWIQYQKTMETRKKALLNWSKHKAAVDRNEKIDPELEKQAQAFETINDTLKHELPLLYDKTKVLMRYLMVLFMSQQKDWFKTCSKKILPLLETEPQHTTSMPYDLKAYVDRFKSDWNPMEAYANRFAIVNRSVLADMVSITSPVPTMNSDDGNSSRNSSSRRTESIGSEMSALEPRNRNSGGYGQRSQMRSFEGPPRSSPAGAAYPSITQVGPSRSGPGPSSLRELRALSPASDDSDVTVTTVGSGRPRGSSRARNYMTSLDGAFEDDPYALPPSIGASFLSPTFPNSQPVSQPTSAPSSSRTSGVFNSALPMSDSPVRASVEDLPATPGEQDEPEVLFLAASLFEFNIAHDRREGGIPYLVYVPGEIFDVIGMKGELWLARNQDDPSKTVGWIWEKHFARILPEDA